MSLLKKIKSKLPIIKEQIGIHTYFIFGNKNAYRNILSENSTSFKRSYSLDGEDMLLISLYEEQPNYKGFYVDIGAHDPIRFSNTQYFYEKGWRGINIDATPGSMKRFNIFRPEDINLECAVSDKNEELIYYCFEESALNSFNALVAERRIENGWELKEKIAVHSQSINSILETNLPQSQFIDFINIDVEGMELKILRLLDFQKYAPKYFLIEDLENVDINIDEIKSEIVNFMKSKKYYPMLKCRRTIIYAREI